MTKRRQPYTSIGIRRVRCAIKGCTRKGYAAWQICADGRTFRAICGEHDIELNTMVIRWAGFPNAEKIIARYAAKVRAIA
jgi:hypothetical protein